MGATREPSNIDDPPRETIQRRGLPPWMAAALLIVLSLGTIWLATADNGGEGDETTPPTSTTPTPASTSRSSESASEPAIPQSLVAAEVFLADPSAAALAELVESTGGIDAEVLGRAEGAFDLVRFDPLDSDRLLASVRSSYGDALNQETNELWSLDGGEVSQTLWAPRRPHDFVHFNVDGTITMWVAEDDTTGFAPRRATLLDNDGRIIAESEPLYASRFTVADGSVFALTGDGDYYSNERSYVSLVGVEVVEESEVQALDAGPRFGWIDNPSPELLVAYPTDATGVTAVWDTATLLALDDHPLGGRSYQRVAVSGDRRTAVGITFDGELEQIDLVTGEVITRFGSVEVRGVDQAITLNRAGTIAVTVERSGLVSLWWVGGENPVAVISADAAQPRWVSEAFGAMTTSVVAPDATRLAIRSPARPGRPVQWAVIDISENGLVDRACRLAGRSLSALERQSLGLPATPIACPD